MNPKHIIGVGALVLALGIAIATPLPVAAYSVADFKSDCGAVGGYIVEELDPETLQPTGRVRCVYPSGYQIECISTPVSIPPIQNCNGIIHNPSLNTAQGSGAMPPQQPAKGLISPGGRTVAPSTVRR